MHTSSSWQGILCELEFKSNLTLYRYRKMADDSMRNCNETRTSLLPFHLPMLLPCYNQSYQRKFARLFHLLSHQLACFPSTLFLWVDSTRWTRGDELYCLIGMALDRQSRCETIRDTKRKLFCICTCSYTAASPENDDTIHCFRKSVSCNKIWCFIDIFEYCCFDTFLFVIFIQKFFACIILSSK